MPPAKDRRDWRVRFHCRIVRAHGKKPSRETKRLPSSVNNETPRNRPVSSLKELMAVAAAAREVFPKVLADVLKHASVDYVPYNRDTHEGTVM